VGWEFEPGRPLVFNHIPKTAGTSLREAVRACLPPGEVFIGFDRSVLGPAPDVSALPRVLRRQCALSPADLPGDAVFISGHISPSTTRGRFPDSDHFTVLREPRVRLISQWLYARGHSDFNLRHWGELGAWMRAARSPLREYADNPAAAQHVDNGILRLLLWPHDLMPSGGFIDPAHDDELFEEAVALLDAFAYVGVIENPEFLAELGAWLGHPLSPQRLNEANRLRQPDQPDLEAEVAGDGEELLRWRSRIDTRLWEHVGRRAFGGDANEVMERTYRDAVERYETLIADPPRLSYPRRIAERSYSLLTAHRRRAS
jgi:hypothetical protein